MTKVDIKDIKLFMLDMDGTVFLENELLPGVNDFLATCKTHGVKVVYLTNNSSKNRISYVEKLTGLGLDVEIDEIFTSGDATIRYIQQKQKDANIFLLGNELLEQEFEAEGLSLVKEANQAVDYVVLGFDTTLTYEKIWLACDYLRAGVPFVATHPDLNCPLKDNNYMPDTGAMIKMFEAATNVSPKIIGKPNTSLVDVISEKYNINRNNICMVGDRLYTDIKMAVDAEITSVLVLSGETKLDDLKDEAIKPTYVLENLGGLNQLIA